MCIMSSGWREFINIPAIKSSLLLQEAYNVQFLLTRGVFKVVVTVVVVVVVTDISSILSTPVYIQHIMVTG